VSWFGCGSLESRHRAAVKRVDSQSLLLSISDYVHGLFQNRCKGI
jgi:hypothetical protein